MKMVGLIATDLSGTMGGVVASRNRAGGYFRAHVIPINPNSAAQANMRSDFAASSSAYHGLTDVQKANWNAYAATYYTPRGGRIPGMSYTGQNAFIGHRMNLFNMNRLNPADDVTIIAPVGSTVAPTPANTSYLGIPSNVFAGQGTSGGSAISLTATDVSYDVSAKRAIVKLNYGGGGSPISSSPVDFVDFVSGLDFGIIVLASLGTEQAISAPKRPNERILASSGIIGAYSGTGTTDTSVTIQMANIENDGFMDMPVAGDIVTYNVYAISSEGHSQPLGQVRQVVVA